MSAAVSKVIYNSNVLIDLTEDTVSADKLLEGITAHDAAGNPITGTLVSTDTTDATASASDIAKGKTAYVNEEKITGSITVFNGIRITARNATIAKPTDASDSEGNKLISNSLSLGTDYLIRAGKYTIQLFAEAYGDAQPEDVAAGKTFTSAAGAIVTGTKTESTPNLTTGSATPSKAAQTFTPDGYDGYSAFTVAAIPGEYIVPSGTKEITTNGTVDVTEYAKVTVAVPTSGGNSTDNCEAYEIDPTNPAVSFQTASGTIKVYGYAYETSSSSWGVSSTTVYAFCGDGYYKAASWGTPTKTSCTFNVSDGQLTGLPTLDGGTLLVVRGLE